MDTRTYLQHQMVSARRQVDATLQGITEEQFNWTPPGTISPVSTILLHVISGEDFFIQTLLQGEGRCWDLQEWAAKVGVQAPPASGGNWDDYRGRQFALPPILAFQQAVRKCTDEYLASLTDEELERPVQFAGRPSTVADVLATLVVHIASHAGEMAAVKGVQGVKGLPF